MPPFLWWCNSFNYGHIPWWLLLLLKFNFEMIYKPGKKHVIPNYLFKLHTKKQRVHHDDVVKDLGVGLYIIHENWVSPLQHYLGIDTFPNTLDWDQQRRFAIKALPYSLVGMKFHKLCRYGIICTWVSSTEAHEILKQLHDGPIRGHFGPFIITRKILAVGYW